MEIAELEKLAAKAAGDLPKVTTKKMFGCQAWWANDNVFALVWKHGRIGVKLPDSASFDELMAIKGSEPWKAGPMTMAHWVLVPETLHAKPAELKKWAKQAYDLCKDLEPKAKAKKKPAAKKKAK